MFSLGKFGSPVEQAWFPKGIFKFLVQIQPLIQARNLKTRSGPTDPALELEILFWSPGISDPALDPQIQPWSLRSSPGASDQVLESQIQPCCL